MRVLRVFGHIYVRFCLNVMGTVHPYYARDTGILAAWKVKNIHSLPNGLHAVVRLVGTLLQ